MDKEKILIYGREFCRSTLHVLEEAKKRKLEFDFFDIDFDEEADYFIRHNKIAGLPVVKIGKVFAVGKNSLKILEKHGYKLSIV